MSENEQLLTKEEVWDVMEFASALNQDLRWLYGGGLYTPDILNQNLINLNNQPLQPTVSKLKSALESAVSSADTLRSFVQYMEYFDTIFNRVLEYKANMLSFDLAWSCSNAKGSDYKSAEYKDDELRVIKFLNNFDYKRYFKDIVKNLLRNGVYYCWMRESDKTRKGIQKHTIQILPQKYCKLTGNSNVGALFDIDLTFLLSGTVDLGLYDEVFGKYYKEIFNTDSNNNYVPSNRLDSRDGSWAYWVQSSPDDGAWAFLYDSSTFNTVPPLASLMKNTILDAEVQKLQYDKNIAEAYGMLVGEMKMRKDLNQPNQFAINPKSLGGFLNLVQQGLNKNIKVGAMPVEDPKFYQFQDHNPNMYSTQTQTTASVGVGASRVIYSTDRASEAELIAQITTDAAPLKKLYAQFEQFLNFFVNQKMKKYYFNFTFRGLDYWFDKEERRDALEFGIDRGLIPNATFFAQAMGYPPHIFKQALDEGKNGDLSDLLGQLKSIHTASGSGLNDEGGRPRKKRVRTESRDYDKRGTSRRS